MTRHNITKSALQLCPWICFSVTGIEEAVRVYLQEFDGIPTTVIISEAYNDEVEHIRPAIGMPMTYRVIPIPNFCWALLGPGGIVLGEW